MTGLGHFPMSENPEGFKSYVAPLLREMVTRSVAAVEPS
jgi:hypothetical protein